MIYQVIDWDAHFENAKSRTYDECSFVCMPNKQHGLGFKRIWSQPDGPAIFGCWCALIQTLSRQKKPRQGYLTDTGRIPAGYCTGNGRPGDPLTPDDLAFMWGCSVELVQRMLEVCSGPKVGWLKALPDQIPEGYQTDTGRIPQSPEEKRREEKRREEKGTPPPGCALLISALKTAKAAGAEPREAEALGEWIEWLTNEVGCESDAENAEVIRWATKEAGQRGVEVRYKRHLAKPDWLRACITHIKDWRQTRRGAA